MLIDVVNVRTTQDFQLELGFQNGERRRFDMRPLLSMRPWNRIAASQLFHRAAIACETVVWPGEIDISPETLYDDSVPLL
ncbi:MAG: hypothetical protein A2V79_04060 [Betaproteobacteria bacterium RBG_16_56_24]|nr:MAG: hypothetical protein A2V79_04060 [Betaproteobacteria bacterium RBG_16_56_24]